MTQDELKQITEILNNSTITDKVTGIVSKLNINPAPQDAQVVVKESYLKYGFFVVSILLFLFDIVNALWIKKEMSDPGVITATAFILMLVGLIFYFPSIICDATGGPSTMRIVVLAVVFVFSFVYIKAAREAGTLSNLKIDQSWIYILGLAFGSKVFQKFAENDTPAK